MFYFSIIRQSSIHSGTSIIAFSL